MKFQFYVEKMNSLDEHDKFLKENPKAFLCSGFFVLDKSGKESKQHLDYFVPGGGKGKLFSFVLEENKLTELEKLDEKVPEKINLDFDFDFEEVEKKISNKMEKEKIKAKIQKMIFSLQEKEGKPFLIGTIFISMLGLLKIHFDILENKVILFEKINFFDMVKIVKKDKKK